MSLDPLQNFYRATVSVEWATGAGNRYVSTKPTPTNGYIVINPGSSTKREVVKYTGTGTDATGDYVTIASAGDRGLGGTTDQTHEVGEAVRMNITAQHWQLIGDAIDAIVAGGAQDASTTVKGISKLSTAPVSASNPIVVGDNDIRVPSANPTTLFAPLLSAVPTGSITMFGSSTPPTGWLNCDGTAISRTTYSGLFAVISSTFGSGDGSTTFNLPDLRSVVPVGYGQKTLSYTFDGASGVDPSTDLITVPSGNALYTGSAISLSGSNLPTGTDTYNTGEQSYGADGTLSGIASGYLNNGDKVKVISTTGTSALTVGSTYYVINATSTTCQFSLTQGGAQTGTGDSGAVSVARMISSTGVFYAIVVSGTTIKLASSQANANANTPIDITADGSGTCTATITYTNRTMGAVGGEETHGLSESEMPSHNHGINNTTSSTGSTSSVPVDSTSTSANTDNISVGIAGGDISHNNMPPFTVVNYIIKT